MKKLFTLGLFSVLAAGSVYADATSHYCIQEAKYNGSNILFSENTIYYNNKDLKVLKRNETETEIVTWQYDQSGRMIQEDNHYLDVWGNNDWVVSNSLRYTYDTSGKILTESYYMRGWSGTFGIARFVEYIYDDSGNLNRQLYYNDETKNTLNQITEYTEYTETGKPGKKSISYVTDEVPELYNYELYSYNENDQLYQTDGYGKNYVTMEIYLSNRTTYTYNDEGKKTEEVSGNFSMSDGTFSFTNRTEYIYDEETGLLSQDVNYYWAFDTATWMRSMKIAYVYTDQLDGANKAPRFIEAEAGDEQYHLSWMCPVTSEGISGFNVYVNNILVETTAKNRFYCTITAEQLEKGNNLIYVVTLYDDVEANISDILQLESFAGEEIEYPMPTFGGISYIKEVNYQIEYEVWWNAPETDMEVTGYTVHFGNWPLTEDPVQGTSYRCTLRKMLDNITWGVSAHYADGGESEADNKDYSLNALLTSIQKSGADKDVWSYAGNICIDGTKIRSVEIFDAAGMKVHEQVINNGINLIKLPNNVYVIKAITEKGVIIRKVFNK